MAVSKTPRKKPVTTLVEEAKPVTKAKTTPSKKAAPKKAEPAAAKAKVSSKSPAKAKVAKSVAAVETVEVLETVQSVEPAPAVLVTAPVVAEPVERQVPGTPSLSPLAQNILTAICEGRAVEFIFADADANAPRTFEPRNLTFDALSQAWYVWGWDRRYNAERHHRVDLLAEVNAVEGVGRAAQGPYPDGTPANLIGGWMGGEPIAVKVSLLKQWVFAVKQAPPAFPNFKIEEQGDGQALVSFSATDLRAIARWAMQFGDGIQVLEPARLVDRVKQVGAVWAGRDRQAAPAPSAAPKPTPRHESRHEPRPESRPEPRTESRPEPTTEPRRHEARPPREFRPEREREEAPKAKPGKVEVIRFDRL